MSGGRRQDDRRKPGHRTKLAEADSALWNRIAKTISPLKRDKGRVPTAQVDGGPAPPPWRDAAAGRETSADGAPQSRPEASAKALRAVAARAPMVAPPRSPAQSAGQNPGIERRQRRRIAAGQIEIEARLDLHGLTQTTAHDRLAGFLARSAAKGLRMVLVITGKGNPLRTRTDGWPRHGDESDYGVLRRNVPRWLEEPGLRAIVVGYTIAAPHHGGEGAFYVQLRRRRGPANPL